MNSLVTISAVAALLGAALMGGIFFAFSNFVMKALGRMPSSEGIAAMQSINIVVLNRWFLGIFIGTAVVCLLLAAYAIGNWGAPSARWLFGGALLYVAGTFLVTILGNVPLNDELAAVCVNDPAAITLWERYLDRWTTLNTARTLAGMSAALMFVIGLMR